MSAFAHWRQRRPLSVSYATVMPQMPGEKLHDFLPLFYRQHSLPLQSHVVLKSSATKFCSRCARRAPGTWTIELYSIILSLGDFLGKNDGLGNFRHGLS